MTDLNPLPLTSSLYFCCQNREEVRGDDAVSEELRVLGNEVNRILNHQKVDWLAFGLGFEMTGSMTPQKKEQWADEPITEQSRALTIWPL